MTGTPKHIQDLKDNNDFLKAIMPRSTRAVKAPKLVLKKTKSLFWHYV